MRRKLNIKKLMLGWFYIFHQFHWNNIHFDNTIFFRFLLIYILFYNWYKIHFYPKFGNLTSNHSKHIYFLHPKYHLYHNIINLFYIFDLHILCIWITVSQLLIFVYNNLWKDINLLEECLLQHIKFHSNIILKDNIWLNQLDM